jgi:hypothetical protein
MPGRNAEWVAQYERGTGFSGPRPMFEKRLAIAFQGRHNRMIGADFGADG